MLKTDEGAPGRPSPPGYGKVWKEHGPELEWYTWMHQGRLRSHQCFQSWFRSVDRRQRVESVLELGCGLAVGYSEFFKDIRYVGADLVEESIAWCRANRRNPRHEYQVGDAIASMGGETFDVVFSQGTIDNTYDMDAFLRAAAAHSRRWVYLTAYRGFFPDLKDHVYSWHEEHGCYYNDISPARTYETLRAAGCRDVAVLPFYTGREDIPFETLIHARVRDD